MSGNPKNNQAGAGAEGSISNKDKLRASDKIFSAICSGRINNLIKSLHEIDNVSCVKDEYGYSPLMKIACMRKPKDPEQQKAAKDFLVKSVKLIIEKGGVVNTVNNFGESIFSISKKIQIIDSDYETVLPSSFWTNINRNIKQQTISYKSLNKHKNSPNFQRVLRAGHIMPAIYEVDEEKNNSLGSCDLSELLCPKTSSSLVKANGRNMERCSYPNY